MTVQGEGGSGRRLGRYHLAESLGAGPTGEVFRAKVYGVAGFERQFAVKRFHAELVSDPDRAGLLAQASREHGALQHPRIARLHEFAVAGGETFAATELVRGLDLHRLIARAGSRTGLPPGAAAGLVAAAARAVGFAHARGLAHLGIAPTNLLCTVDGDVKVTDFGHLARRLPARPAEDPGLARRAAYLAPEQLRGEPGTSATDVFQLGLIACELLTGQSPAAGADPGELERRARAGEPAPIALELPRALGQVIRRALAQAPAERFPEAAALADALDAAARSSPLPGDRRDLAAVVRVAIDEQIAREDVGARGPGPSMAPTGVPPSTASSSAKVGRVTLTGNPAPRGSAGPRADPRLAAVPPRPETSEEATRVRDDEEVGPPTRVMPEHMVRTLVGQPSPTSSRGAVGGSSRSITSPTSVVPAATRMAGLAGQAASEPPPRGRPAEAGSAAPSEDERETRRREVIRRGTPDAFEREGTDGDFYAVDTVTKQRAELGALAARGSSTAPPTAGPAEPRSAPAARPSAAPPARPSAAPPARPSAAPPLRPSAASPPRSSAAARPSPPMRGGLPGSMRVSAEDGLPMSPSLARAAESARMARPTARNTLAGSLRAAAEGEARSEDETRVADPLADPQRAALASRADTDGPSPDDETRVADGPLAEAHLAALASSRAGTDVNGPEDETRVNPGPRGELPTARHARREPAGARPERAGLAGSLSQAAEDARSAPPRTTLVGAGRVGADPLPRPTAGARPLGSGPAQAVAPPGASGSSADERRGARPGAIARPDSGTPLPEVRSPPPDILTPMPELAEMLSLSDAPPRPALSAPFAPPSPPPPASIAGSAARFAAAAARDSRPPAPMTGGPSARDSRPPAPMTGGPSPRDSRPPAPMTGGPSPRDSRPPTPVTGGPSARDSRPPAPMTDGSAPARTLFGAPPAPPYPAGHPGPGPSTAPPPPGRFASGPSGEPPRSTLSPPSPWQPAAPDPRFALDPDSLPDPRVGPGPSRPPPMEAPAIPGDARAARPSGAPRGEGPSLPRRAEPAPGPSFTLPEKPGGGLRVALFGLLLVGLAGGGYVGYLALYGDGGTPASAAAPGSGPAGSASASGPAPSNGAAPPAPASSAAPASGTAPASSAAPASAGSAAAARPSTAEPPAGRADPTGELVIESVPDRARVYLDGAVVGKTPLTLEGNNDRHKLAIIAPGYKPHTAEVDGRGRVPVTLEEVTPSNGPAGIKVRCKQKNRYYVTLDGEPTGQLCPTERLGVELGDHVVEIYDPVTDSRRTYKVKVDQTRFSHRVRVD